MGVILLSHRKFADKTGCQRFIESGVEFFEMIFGWLSFFVPNSITYQKLEYFWWYFKNFFSMLLHRSWLAKIIDCWRLLFTLAWWFLVFLLFVLNNLRRAPCTYCRTFWLLQVGLCFSGKLQQTVICDFSFVFSFTQLSCRVPVNLSICDYCHILARIVTTRRSSCHLIHISDTKSTLFWVLNV